MSLIRPVLNACLRAVERRRMARAETPEQLRRPFETHARLFFWPPRGSRFIEAEVAGRPATWVNDSPEGPLLLYLHGGGYIFGSPRTHRAMLAHLSRLTGCPALLPDYRKAPEHGFPAAVKDALAVYEKIADHPGGVVLGGDSAGGGLALVLLAEILRRDLRLPLGVFAFSPLTDLTWSGESVTGNAASEVVLPVERCAEVGEMYLQGADPKDPRASPLFAVFPAAPPVWLAASDSEILLDDTRRMTRRLRAQGNPVTETIAPGLPHVWPLMHTLLPEARATLRDLAAWIRHLSRPSVDS